MVKSIYPTEAKTLGEQIRKQRMDKKLSLLEVAQKVGISESYLARIEADKRKPSTELIEKIGNYLKMQNTKDLVLDTWIHYATNFTVSQSSVTKDDLFKSEKFAKLFKQKQN